MPRYQHHAPQIWQLGARGSTEAAALRTGLKVTLWRGNEETGLRTAQQPVRGQPHPHTNATPGLLERLNWDGATGSTMLSPVNVPAPAAPAGECSPRAGAESPCPEPVPTTTRGAALARPEQRRWAGRAQGQLRGYGGDGSASLSFAGQQLHC